MSPRISKVFVRVNPVEDPAPIWRRLPPIDTWPVDDFRPPHHKTTLPDPEPPRKVTLSDVAAVIVALGYDDMYALATGLGTSPIEVLRWAIVHREKSVTPAPSR
jgi:hypothetical protein